MDRHTLRIVGWPSYGLRFSPNVDPAKYLERLLKAQRANPRAFNVYTADTMPERYHFSPANNERIAPIYAVPNIGWAITNRRDFELDMNGQYQPKGVCLISLAGVSRRGC